MTAKRKELAFVERKDITNLGIGAIRKYYILATDPISHKVTATYGPFDSDNLAIQHALYLGLTLPERT